MQQRLAVSALLLVALLLATQVQAQLVPPGAYGGYLPLIYKPVPSPTPLPTATPLPTTPTPTAPKQLVNGNFEAGATGWIASSTSGFEVITRRDLGSGFRPHSGNWYTWLGGAEDDTSAIIQEVTIPANGRLVYWHWIASQEVLCGADYDIGGVVLDFGNSVREAVDAYALCRTTNTPGWRQRTINVSQFAGRNALLIFIVGTDGSYNSNLFVDDVTLRSGAAQNAPAPESVETTPDIAATQHGGQGGTTSATSSDLVQLLRDALK